jgi:tetratricopeptide (TPR) repeat protein
MEREPQESRGDEPNAAAERNPKTLRGVVGGLMYKAGAKVAAAVQDPEKLRKSAHDAAEDAADQIAIVGWRLRTLPVLRSRRFSLYLALAGFVATLLIFFLFIWVSPGSLRREARAALEAGDLPLAQQKLAELEQKVGRLSARDQAELAEPVRAAVASTASRLLAQLAAQRKAAQWDEARVTLHQIDQLGFDPGLVMYNRAEIARFTRRGEEAIETYRRYADLYPASELADDALYWGAISARTYGDNEGARVLLRRLLKSYPRSNFVKLGQRLLDELSAER